MQAVRLVAPHHVCHDRLHMPAHVRVGDGQPDVVGIEPLRIATAVAAKPVEVLIPELISLRRRPGSTPARADVNPDVQLQAVRPGLLDGHSQGIPARVGTAQFLGPGL